MPPRAAPSSSVRPGTLPPLVLLAAAAALLLALLPALVTAQVSLPAQPELPRLLDLCAQRLNLRISYDESALKAKITLRADQPLSDAELWTLTNRLLVEQGFTTIRAGDDDTIAVVKLASAASLARLERRDLHADPGPPPPASPNTAPPSSLPSPSALPTPGALPRPPAHPPILPGFRRFLIPLQRCSTKDALAAAQLLLSKSAGTGGAAGVVAESEQAGFIIIADLAPSLDSVLTLLQQLDGPDGGAIVREVPARNLDPTRLAALVKQLVEKRKSVGGRDLRGELLPSLSGPSSGNGGNGNGGGGLILICPPGLVDQWLALIASADQREPVERRTYTPGSFPARDVANLIEQTVRSGPTSSVSALAGPTSTSASTTTSSPLGADDRWKLIIDDLTGTLIITATAAQHDQIAELLDRLAAIPAEARRAVRSFKLRNRPVKEVQQVVEDLLRAGVLQAQAAGDSNSPTPGPAFRGSGVPPASPQSSARPFTPGSAPADSPAGTFPLAPNAARAAPRPSGPASPLTLTSDEATNTLIAVVNGSEPRLLAQLEQLLPTLDIRQPQVMLEATLVSLSDSESISLGAELERIQLSGDTLIKLSSLFGLSAAAGAGSALTRTVGDGAGFTGAVLNPGDFSVVLRALQTVNHGRSLSNPKLLVNNNQQASFNSVLQQPFSSTNASSTVSTTSFGGTQDAGTTISIKPQIAEGDHLVLTYSVSLSSFVGAAANANLPPPRQQNSVQSVATIPDGYTVVVGGLELLTSGKGVSQIPFLADIPFIGEAFKNRANDSGRQRFYVFLRATILRQHNLEDLKYLSDQSAAAVDVPTGWPDVEPLVIGGRFAESAR